MSSKRRLRRNACKNKKRYATKKDALIVRAKMRAVGRGSFITPYNCPFCSFWHLGRSGGRKRTL